jgi:hypothetical protein
MVQIFVEQFALKSLLDLGVTIRLKSESAKCILEHFYTYFYGTIYFQEELIIFKNKGKD